MPLDPDTTLGPYQVTAKIGEGGMGEVYRARDTKLDRDVALKVLPQAFTDDPDRLARFEREAKVLASLNHPNIGHIYGLEEAEGTKALVLELIEGPTLADRIKQGPVPVDEALPIAKQIAEALEAAHEQGIIHRDLKPANIKLKPDGTVKVLDFGLAKAFQPDASDPNLSQSPTISLTAAATQMGMVIGTAAYMAPEQAKGLPVDKRADIWAYGAVLFEMLTGNKLFQAKDVSEVLASVLVKDPDVSSIGGRAPGHVRAVVRRCLVKDPRHRLRDIGDVRLLLDRQEASDADGLPATQSDRRASWLWPALAAIGFASAGAMAILDTGPPATVPPEAVTFDVREPGRLPGIAVLSPNGRNLLFATRATEDGGTQLAVRSLDTLESEPIPGTEGVLIEAGAVWSPGSDAVAYATGGGLYRVDVVTGQARLLVERSFDGRITGAGAWSAEGTLLFSSRSGIWSIPETGGDPDQVTAVADGTVAHLPSGFLPSERRFLYFVGTVGFFGMGAAGEIKVGSLDVPPDGQDDTVLVDSESPARYAPAVGEVGATNVPGFLLFVRRGILVAQRFDATIGDFIGDPEQVASSVGTYSLAETGTIAYAREDDRFGAQAQLINVDRSGAPVRTIGSPSQYNGVSLFGDGRRMAVGRRDRGEPVRLQVVDLSRGAFTELNPGSSGDYGGVPSPDGDVAFTMTPEGVPRDIYVRAANGVGDARLLVESDTVKHPNDWSPDGEFLIYDDHRPGMAQDLFLVRQSGGDPIPFLATGADEAFGRFSPDGNWIAYRSNESGSPEVYVRDFAPDQVPAYGSEREQITVAGGDKPQWSPDGTEIFFVANDGALMVVPVRPGRPFEVGSPTRLFRANFTSYVPYDVMPDGGFMTVTAIDTTAALSPIVVRLNWQAALP